MSFSRSPGRRRATVVAAAPLRPGVEPLEVRRHFAAFAGEDVLVQPVAGPFATVGGPPFELYGTTFTLIDANGADLATFGTGAVINLQKYGTALNVRVDTPGAVGSFRFGMDGQRAVRTVNRQDATLFAQPAALSVGTHAVLVQSFSGPQGTGQVLATSAVQFTVVDEPEPAPAAGRLYASASSVAFGEVPVGESVTQPVMLTNPQGPGERAITIRWSRIFGGASFGEDVVNDYEPVVLAPGDSRTINVTFTPVIDRPEGRFLQIENDGPSPHLAVVLEGTGTPAPAGAAWSVPDQIQQTVGLNAQGQPVITITWHTAEPDASSVLDWWQSVDAIFQNESGVVTSSGPGGAFHAATFTLPVRGSYAFHIWGKGDAITGTMNIDPAPPAAMTIPAPGV